MARIIIIMGVSGSGKSTIGKNLASVLELPFFDADDFHPKSNIDKMRQNIPLNDVDRKPRLEHLALELKQWSRTSGAILACSALKEAYRDVLSAYVNTIEWVVLLGQFKTIQDRMSHRKDHFMTAALLQSQFDTLEEPSYGYHIDIEQDYEHTISDIIEKLNSNG